MSQDKEKEEFLKELEELQNFLNSTTEENLDDVLKNMGINLEELERNMNTSMVPKIELKYVGESDLLYNYPTDSGFDLYSTESITIPPFGRSLIPTGVYFDIPEGFEVQIRSKSGLAIKQGLMVLNSPGTIDEGYTGEIKVILFNVNNHKVTINKGMKVAQAVLSRCLQGRWVDLIKVDTIPSKDRNENGFGSTGI
jgi:dUTP pyrophosphatase